MGNRMSEVCYMEFGGIRIYSGPLRNCIHYAIGCDLSHKDVDIISQETGEVFDIDWSVNVQIFETRRQVACEVSI